MTTQDVGAAPLPADLPDNSLTYDYKVAARARIGGLDFIADGAVRDDTPAPPDSDTARAKIFLASKGFRMESRNVLVERLVHLVGQDRRNELMILYVESPGGGRASALTERGEAAIPSSDLLAGLLQRATENLTLTP